MARKFGGQASDSGSNELRCLTCGEILPRAGAFKFGLIAHCESKSAAFSAIRMEAHHVRRKHPRCWCCITELGCERCSGIARELLCVGPNGSDRALARFRDGQRLVAPGSRHQGRGPVWATSAALLEHGMLSGQTLDDYPVEWREDYRRTMKPAQAGVNNIAALVAVVTTGTKRH